MIAVDQQNGARDQTFEGIPDYRCPLPAGSRSIVGSILPDTSTCLKPCIGVALLVASSLLNTCIKFFLIFELDENTYNCQMPGLKWASESHKLLKTHVNKPALSQFAIIQKWN